MIPPAEHAIDNLRHAPEDEQGRVSLDTGDRDLVVAEVARLRAIERGAFDGTPRREQAVDTIVTFAHRNAPDERDWQRVLDALHDLGVTDDEIRDATP